MGLLASLAALGEARLRRGIGVLARWQVPAGEWEAFRAFDTRRQAEHVHLLGHYTPRPAQGRAVEVVFGHRQVIVDESYHPLSRFALPEITWLAWHEPADAPANAPECLEFGVLYPGGRYGGARRMAVRVPVARAARQDGVRVWHHFQAAMPKPREPLLFRYPRRVIGGGLAATVLAATVAAATWLLDTTGGASGTLMGTRIVAIAVAIASAVVTLILAIVLLLSRRSNGGKGTGAAR